jgi:ubiquinone/menaquinone biosynthesis C-methylase UbiE
MYIFQPERIILRKQVIRYSKYITGKTLDIGAGEGGRYKGLFPCSEYLTMDVEKFPGVDVVGRAENIPLSDQSMDSIVCTQVMEHLNLPFDAVKEFYRILKPGGHILITAPQINELHEEPNDFFRYTKFGLISMFEGIGFETIIFEQRGGFFTTIAQMKIRYMIDKFRLYKKPIIGKIVGKIILLYGKFAMWLDRLDPSDANRKNTLGWCFVFKK